jgi:uncharacterized membrane protein
LDFKLLANIFGAIGMVLFFVTAAFKSKKLVLSIQSCGHVFLGISDIFAGSYSSLAQEALCIARDIGIITKKANLAFKLIIIALIAGVGITVNIKYDQSNIFGFIAITGNLLFTIDIFFNNKSAIGFKLVSAVSSFGWMSLFLNYGVYTSAIANGASGLINLGVAIYIFINYKEGKMNRLGHRTNWNEERKNHVDTTLETGEKENTENDLLK